MDMTGGQLILIVSSKGISKGYHACHGCSHVGCIAPSKRSPGCLLALLSSSAADVKVVAGRAEHAVLQAA